MDPHNCVELSLRMNRGQCGLNTSELVGLIEDLVELVGLSWSGITQIRGKCLIHEHKDKKNQHSYKWDSSPQLSPNDILQSRCDQKKDGNVQQPLLKTQTGTHHHKGKTVCRTAQLNGNSAENQLLKGRVTPDYCYREQYEPNPKVLERMCVVM